MASKLNSPTSVAEDDFKMQAVASACLSNIAAERAYKDLVVQVCTSVHGGQPGCHACARARLYASLCGAVTRHPVVGASSFEFRHSGRHGGRWGFLEFVRREHGKMLQPINACQNSARSSVLNVGLWG